MKNMDSGGDPWGLDRIDARSGLSNTFSYTNTGSGVAAYIIDTGIKIDPPDFGGRAVYGYDSVDWFAPGVGIKSAWYTDECSGDGSYTRTISGTPMATPHTAGVAALYLQSNPGAAPLQVRDALYDDTTKGVVSSSKTTNNHLLYTKY